MEKFLIGVAASCIAFFLIRLVGRTFKEWKKVRQAEVEMREQFPVSRRAIPLNRQDKRGWATDRNGWIRPR